MNKLKIKLNKIFSKNPDFVFYDYDNECVGDDLLKLISTLLKEERKKILKIGDKIKEIHTHNSIPNYTDNLDESCSICIKNKLIKDYQDKIKLLK